MELSKIETKKLLMLYADGELAEGQAKAVEAALANDPALQAEVDELRRVGVFARDAFEATVPDVSMDAIYSGVMARLGPAAAKPSGWQRFTTWLGELVRFERPLALAGIAAAIVAVVVGFSVSGGGTSAPAPQNTAEVAKMTPGTRRAPELEHKTNGRSSAYVESYEAAQGKVVIDINEEDPDQPMVLWHVVPEEGTATPKGL